MGKNSKSKRSVSSKPRGLPVKRSNEASNPFEVRGNKRLKHAVMNRRIVGAKRNSTESSSHLAQTISNRQSSLKDAILKSKKQNDFMDHRIGESRGGSLETMTEEEKMLKRLVKERVHRSKRNAKFNLNDQPDGTLTHRGQLIDEKTYNGQVFNSDDVHLSDDELFDKKQLTRADTELHFGGGSQRQQQRRNEKNPYGPTSAENTNLGDVYRSRKSEMEEMITRRKILKAEHMKQKQNQVDAFENMDENFKELAGLLNFRKPGDNSNIDESADAKNTKMDEEKQKKKDKQEATDAEMDEWNAESKAYLFDRKVAATDRTKTPEEIAKEESERLHELETRRLARMNGDFEEDDLSDVELSDDENDSKKKRKLNAKKKKKDKTKKKAKNGENNPDELDDGDEESGDEEPQARFTADGLVYVDKDGNVVKKLGDDDDTKKSNVGGDDESDDYNSSAGEEDDSSDSGESEAGLGDTDDEASVASNEIDDDGGDTPSHPLAVGTKVQGNYRANDQFQGNVTWYDGAVSKVTKDPVSNEIRYTLEYNDGDFEENMEPQHVKPMKIDKKEEEKKEKDTTDAEILKKKKRKARNMARKSMPFIFEVPTTLEALHELISTHASTGADASLILSRIYSANSIRLNRTHKEKMQNFYDVLLRRFIAVGDAIYRSGDGGPELGRYKQLDCITKIIYKMAQDSPSCAAAIWGRRLGVFQKAFAKRLRDSELVNVEDGDDEEGDMNSVWPSMGTILLLRALAHVFPVTDLRHTVVTPALLFLGQILAQAPVRCLTDVVMGILCSGLMIQYTKEAKRVPPEALAFLAGTVRLFAEDAQSAAQDNPVPSLSTAVKHNHLLKLREQVITENVEDDALPKLSLEKISYIGNANVSGVLCATLGLVTTLANTYESALNAAEAETFSEINRALLTLHPKKACRTNHVLPSSIITIIANTACALSRTSQINKRKLPLLRRSSNAKKSHLAVKSLTPRMEDPTSYTMSKDKNKSRAQAQSDKVRREYKREKKAMVRELRQDTQFLQEQQWKAGQKEQQKRKEERNKNYAWMEQEQATVNQQVRLGGGLLKGGGIGVARNKAASAKLGMKKGGKMS